MKTHHRLLILCSLVLIYSSGFSQEVKQKDTTSYNFFQVGFAGGLSNTFLNLTINSGYYLPLEYNAHISFLFSPSPLIGIDFQLGTNISNLHFKFSDFNDVLPNASPADTALVLQNRGYYFAFKGNLDILYLFRYAPYHRIFKWTFDAGVGGIFYEPGTVFYKSGYNSFSGDKYTDQNGLGVIKKVNAKGLTPFIYVGTSFWFKLGERVTLGLNTGYNYQPLFTFDRTDTKNYSSRGDYWQTSIKLLFTIGSSKNNNKFFAPHPSAISKITPINNIIMKDTVRDTTKILPQDTTNLQSAPTSDKPDLLKDHTQKNQDSTIIKDSIDSLNKKNLATNDSTHVINKKKAAVNDSIKRKPLEFDKTVEQLSEQQRQELDSLIKYKGYFNGKTTKLTEYSQKGLDNVIKLLNKYPAARIDLHLYDNTSLSKEIPVKLQRDDVIEYLVKAGIGRIRIGGNAFNRALDSRVKEPADKQRCVIIYLAK